MAVKKHNPDLVGFSAFTPFANPALEAASAVKRINSNILTVLGGPHAVLLILHYKNVLIWILFHMMKVRDK